MITIDRYCVEICGGKCCKVFDSERAEIGRCPKQAADHRCSIFDQWQNGTCAQNKETIGFNTMPMIEALKQNLIPKWIADQCAVQHPELLEVESCQKKERSKLSVL